MDLVKLQAATAKWRDRNFPDHTAEDQLMGMMEELGEITHSFLKRKQGIRGDVAEHEANIADGIGDLLIFTCGFCSVLGIDLNAAVEITWEEVKQRDWIGDPLAGRP